MVVVLAMVPSACAGAIIIDHTCTDLSEIPDEWVEEARNDFEIFYGHTSHGSQIVTGVTMWANSNSTLYASPGFHEISDDLGHNGDISWVPPTENFLDNPSHSQYNVVMWSWCGGVSDNTETGINTYLNAMSQLETDYPAVTFIYMTGHLDGSGETGNLNIRNNQIRNYCNANNKVLFDFADIESYDPDGDTNFMELYANDNCNYDGGNWADEWCTANPDECLSCSYCAHSRCLNCQQKGQAFWHMMARLAGWDGGQPEQPICGDVTDDGAVNTVDLMLLLKHCVNPAGNPLAHECTGDIDGNGHINVLDARLLMEYIANGAGYSLNCPCGEV